ncbi:galactoside ABC transporter, permease protein [Escherichia coli]|jgi:ABC-type glucose/galactose transport system permease subunit|nr:galactoside ABC transporter, permease protein [Escherichia coli]
MSALNKKSFLTYLKEGGIYVVLLGKVRISGEILLG